MTPLQMPGGISMTRLKVYDTLAPDGQRGGTPHFHFLCTELYFVLGGTGAVELINAQGFSRVELLPHSALVFSPGTLHRLINPRGDLELLVIMQNSGLPERGDNAVCFDDEWLASDESFTAAMSANTLAEAYQRRDRGVEGFLELKAAFAESLQSGQAALQRFYDLAAQRIAPRLPSWQGVIESGAAAESRTQFALLNQGTVSHLLHAQHQLIPAPADTSLGFCGHLKRYDDPARLALEGIAQP